MSSGSSGSSGPVGSVAGYGGLSKGLGVTIDAAMLERALTHRSYAYEHGGLPTNERLEFLGDAVLGLVITDTLYRAHPDLPEGQLAKLRAAVVNMKALAGVARSLGLGSYLRLGKGEEATGGRDKSSILADTLEALIGAVYLDRGLEEAARLVHRHFDTLIADSATRGAGLDWKTSLQELTAQHVLGVPEYVIEDSGPDHQKFFRATARVAGRDWGEGEGRSKKEAEQRAAEAAWTAIRSDLGEDGGPMAALGGMSAASAASLAAAGVDPAGAASNGATPRVPTTDGATGAALTGVDGAAVDGAAVTVAGVDGAAVDAATVDGAAVDGAAVDGAAVDGAAADGAAVDGAPVPASSARGAAAGTTPAAG